MCVSLQRSSECFVYCCIFSPHNIPEIPRGGYYHTILQLGKKDVIEFKQSVQVPSVARVCILKLL